MNANDRKPLLDWADELPKDTPDLSDPRVHGAPMFAGPNDQECLPALAKALKSCTARYEQGDTSAAAYAVLTSSAINKIIDGTKVTTISEEVYWPVDRAARTIRDSSGMLSKHKERLGCIRARNQIQRMLDRLPTVPIDGRPGVLDDINGILREYQELKTEFTVPER